MRIEECCEFLRDIHIREKDIQIYSKSQWKNIIKDKIYEKNRCDLLEQIRGYKKLDYFTLSKESFKRKPYFTELTLAQSRLKFQIESKMTRTVRMNYQGKEEYAKELWKCWDC